MGFLDRFRGKKTWDPGEDSTIRFSARARFISHACETLGDPSYEFGVQVDAPGVQDMLIFEFPATETRPRWTYLTAGLSLAPGRRPLFPCELVAYSAEQNPRWADTLFGVAEAIAGAPSSEPFDPGHVVNMVGDDGEVTISFALAQPDEPEELLDFPNVTKRPEDSRFLAAFSQSLAEACPRLIWLAVSVKDRGQDGADG
jgi:hypothetical protein